MRINLYLLCFLVFGYATAQQKTSNDTLAVSEPITIETLLNKKKSFNKNEILLNTYTVQLYSGNYEDARKNLEKFKELHPDHKAVIKFQTPNYKVWVANFPNKLEAEKLFFAAKPDFPSILMFRVK